VYMFWGLFWGDLDIPIDGGFKEFIEGGSEPYSYSQSMSDIKDFYNCSFMGPTV
jgi:hypothetical protein